MVWLSDDFIRLNCWFIFCDIWKFYFISTNYYYIYFKFLHVDFWRLHWKVSTFFYISFLATTLFVNNFFLNCPLFLYFFIMKINVFYAGGRTGSPLSIIATVANRMKSVNKVHGSYPYLVWFRKTKLRAGTIHIACKIILQWIRALWSFYHIDQSQS